jgi:hypothetical protein
MLSWKFGDALEAAGLKKNRWRARPGVSPFDPPSDNLVAAETAREPAGPSLAV